MNFIKKYWLLGVLALMVITIIGCFAYIFQRIDQPLGVDGEIVNPYYVYTTTSTQPATSTATFGDWNPQVSGLYNLGVNGRAWNNITASGTISATTISATTMSPTNITWTNATGTNMTVLNNVTINGTCSGVACGSVVGNYTWTNATGTNTTSTNLYASGIVTFASATATDIFATTGRFSSLLSVDSVFTTVTTTNLNITTGGSAGKITCWKADGITLGYASTTAGSTTFGDGTFDCN